MMRDLLRRHAPVLYRRVNDFHHCEDRQILETRILPALSADPGIERVLFVGCDWYTKPYERLFRGKDYRTLDIDPDKRRYGSSAHVTDRLRNLRSHFAKEALDAIVCNGVFMKTAIETRDEAEPSFAACFDCLRSGGWFVLGWNDVDWLRPYPPSESPALARFDRCVFPALGSSEHVTQTAYRHTYSFFSKP